MAHQDPLKVSGSETWTAALGAAGMIADLAVTYSSPQTAALITGGAFLVNLISEIGLNTMAYKELAPKTNWDKAVFVGSALASWPARYLMQSVPAIKKVWDLTRFTTVAKKTYSAIKEGSVQYANDKWRGFKHFAVNSLNFANAVYHTRDTLNWAAQKLDSLLPSFLTRTEAKFWGIEIPEIEPVEMMSRNDQLGVHSTIQPNRIFLDDENGWDSQRHTAIASPTKRTIVDQCPPKAVANLPCGNCGMFATKLYLLGLMDRYEQGQYSGVKIDFGRDGLYYEPSKGPNWFEYYFKPVNVANLTCPTTQVKTFTDHELGDHSSYAERVYGYEESGLSPLRAKMLFEKYFILKSEIQSEISQFTQTHFAGADHVLAVHYRGTDKSSEARRVPYEEMIQSVQEHLSGLNSTALEKVKIFAASDEEPFIQHISEQFPGQVVTSPSRRSADGKPLHFNAESPYQTGKEALIDCLLLGKYSDALIRTSSNLSKFASLLLKPGAKLIEISKRLYQDPAK